MAEIFFTGPAGRIECRFHRSENPRSPLVLVCSGSPLGGETMNSRLTYTLFQAFVNMGFSVMRFNYRGVGKSEGAADGTSAGEVADGIAILEYLQNLDFEMNTCWLAGWDFGAYVAAQILMRRPEVRGFVFVAPPLNQYNFDFLTPCPASGLIIQGEKDEVVSEPNVALLAEQLSQHKLINIVYRLLPRGNHLFTTTLKQLYETVLENVPLVQINKGKKALKKARNAILPNEDY